MAAGSAYDHLEPTAAERLPDHRIGSAAIDHNGVPQPFAPALLLKKMAKAAQVPFTFLAHVAHKYQVGFAVNSRLAQAHRDGQHRRQPGRVVTHPRAIEPVAILVNRDLGIGGKNRVEVSGDGYGGQPWILPGKTLALCAFTVAMMSVSDRRISRPIGTPCGRIGLPTLNSSLLTNIKRKQYLFC